MTLNLLIAPDFAPERFAGWHMLNTLLQKRSGLQLQLLTPASAAEQAQLIAEGKVDAVYANPFDAASMIRDAGNTLQTLAMLHETRLDPLFYAAADATEQAIIHALWHAEPVRGRDGHKRRTLRDILRRLPDEDTPCAS